MGCPGKILPTVLIRDLALHSELQSPYVIGVFCNQSLNEKCFNPRSLVSSLSSMLCQYASYSIPVVLSVFSLNCIPGGETEGIP